MKKQTNKKKPKLQYIEKTLPRAPWKHTPLSSMICGEFKIRGGIFFLYSIQVLERAGLSQHAREAPWTVCQPVKAHSKHPRFRGFVCEHIQPWFASSRPHSHILSQKVMSILKTQVSCGWTYPTPDL